MDPKTIRMAPVGAQNRRSRHNRPPGLEEDDFKSYLYLMANGKTGDGDLKNKWILDFGATPHMNNSMDILTNVRRTNSLVQMGDGSVVRVHSIGTL